MGKTIVLFPEAAFGPALNCVGIAQQLRKDGPQPGLRLRPGFKGVFEKYGFEENLVDMSGGMSDEEIAKFWANFIAEKKPHFRLSPIDQLPTYVIPVWEAIVDSAIIAEDALNAHLQRIKPDLVAVDNVILFPAIKRAGCPWVRIISCSENEIPDPDIPPHLSGCHENDKAGFKAFEDRFLELVKPTHARFNEFLAKVGPRALSAGRVLRGLAGDEPAALSEAAGLQAPPRRSDPKQFQYLEGCVRDEGTYQVPQFKANNDKPLIYVSYGSLGAADVELYQRMIGALRQAALPLPDECRRLYRRIQRCAGQRASGILVPAAGGHSACRPVHPSRRQQQLQRGACSSASRRIIMPFCWDGLDNAARIHDTGYGDQLPRYTWTDEQLCRRRSRA